MIAASAGNHAQGLALAAQRLGVWAVIVMPRTIPELKVKDVLARDGEALLHGDVFPGALAYALQLAERESMAFVSPYDNPGVVAGQGTAAIEIPRQYDDRLDVIFAPADGDSLTVEIAAYVKHLRPGIRVTGVELENPSCLQATPAAGERIVLDQVRLFADGVTAAQIGTCSFEVCKDHVDEAITVGSGETYAAIRDIYDNVRSVTEPAGILAVTGIKKYTVHERTERQTLVAIDSGVSIGFDRLRHATERAKLGEQHEVIIVVTMAERPGGLKAFYATLDRCQITGFNCRYHSGRWAYLFAGMQTYPLTDSCTDLPVGLRERSFPVLDLADNEVAKLHTRHMVGGHGTKMRREWLFHFEFPERPGALLNLLDKLGLHWNTSLSHYRNRGVAGGRMLAGSQVLDEECGELEAVSQAAGYPHWGETHNPAYRLFTG